MFYNYLSFLLNEPKARERILWFGVSLIALAEVLSQFSKIYWLFLFILAIIVLTLIIPIMDTNRIWFYSNYGRI